MDKERRSPARRGYEVERTKKEERQSAREREWNLFYLPRDEGGGSCPRDWIRKRHLIRRSTTIVSPCLRSVSLCLCFVSLSRPSSSSLSFLPRPPPSSKRRFSFVLVFSFFFPFFFILFFSFFFYVQSQHQTLPRDIDHTARRDHCRAGETKKIFPDIFPLSLDEFASIRARSMNGTYDEKKKKREREGKKGKRGGKNWQTRDEGGNERKGQGAL